MITEHNAESHVAAAASRPDSDPSIENQNGGSSPVSNPQHSAVSCSPIQNPKSKFENCDGALLLNELESLLTRFVVLPERAAETLALWIVHTYAFELRDVSTYLGVESPEKRCGKTTLLSVLSRLANRPVAAANISPSAFFRVIEEMRPTLLIDEADTFLRGNDELRGILNAGYTRDTAYVVRVAQADVNGLTSRQASGDGNDGLANVPSPLTPALSPSDGERGKTRRLPTPSYVNRRRQKHYGGQESTTEGGPALSLGGRETKAGNQSVLKNFSCWCPKVMAAIGRLPDTLSDRCIVIRMERKTIHEDCDRLRKFEASNLRERCAQFVSQNRAAIASAEPEIPESLHDRAADIWEPLFVLADLAGGDWPCKAREAAEKLATGAQTRSPIGAFLIDIYYAMGVAKADRIFSRDLVNWLNGFTDRPWHELPGLRIVDCGQRKRVTELWLAEQLRPYGIRPRTIRIGERTQKGYTEADLIGPFKRYVPLSEWQAFKAEAERERAEREAAESAKNQPEVTNAAATVK